MVSVVSSAEPISNDVIDDEGKPIHTKNYPVGLVHANPLNWWASDNSDVGCGGHFGRSASLYRHQLQLFGRLWVRLPLPAGQFSEI